MKKFLLTVAAVLGFASQAGSKTQITLDQLTAPTTQAVMVSIPGRGWVQAQFDSTITLNTATNPPTISANGGPPPTFVDAVIPTGVVDGTNTVFNLPSVPSPATSLEVILNGLTLQAGPGAIGADFTLSGSTITFNSAPSAGGKILAYYRR